MTRAELLLAAKRLHRRSQKGHRSSLRAIAAELAAMGYTNKNGELDLQEQGRSVFGHRAAFSRLSVFCLSAQDGATVVATGARWNPRPVFYATTDARIPQNINVPGGQ